MTVPAVHGGLGCTIEYGGAASGAASWSAIYNVTTLDGPSFEMGQVETTNLASTVKTFRPTLPDLGEVSGTLQFDYTSHSTLVALMLSNTAQAQPGSTTYAGQWWRLTFNDLATFPGTQFVFTGILTKFEPKGMESEANLEADFSIKLTGSISV